MRAYHERSAVLTDRALGECLRLTSLLFIPYRSQALSLISISILHRRLIAAGRPDTAEVIFGRVRVRMLTRWQLDHLVVGLAARGPF